MADVNINKFRASVVRDGSKPASPGFIVSEGQDPVNPPGTNNYVPYSGATANVELGEYGVEAGFITLDTTPTNTPTDQGTIFWDADDETVDIVLNGYTMKIGEDLFYPVKNQTGSTIAKGVAVRFNGTVGASGRLLIAPFIADGSVPSSRFMGVTAEEILNGEDGKVLYFGRVRGINTNAFNEGDILYASTTVAGGYQTAIPVAPNNIVQVAAVVTKSATVGTIFVRPTLGSNINKDEGVKITSVADKNLLQYQSGTSLWENKSLAQVLGGTSAQFVKGDGSLDSTSYQPLLTNPVTGTGTTNYLSKFTGASTIGNSQIFDDGTNIGIGTASPASNLQVASSSSPVIAMNLIGSATSGPRGDLAWYNSSISTVALIRATAVTDNVGTQLEFYTRPSAGSLTQAMTITSGGNVGINVTPTSGNRFWVKGSSTSSGDSTILAQNSAGTNLFYVLNNGNVVMPNGNVLIGTTTDNGARFQVSGRSTVTDSVGGNTIMEVSNTNTTNGFGLFVRGGVGSTSYALNIVNAANTIDLFKVMGSGAATFSSSLTVNTTATIKSFLYLGESLVENGVINSPEGIYINADSDASGGTNDIVFGKGRTSTSGGTTFMTIKNGGNVGIGTSSPTGRFMLYQSSAGNVFQNIVSNQGGSTQVGINLSPSMTDGEVAANPAQASIYATDLNYGANIIFATKTTGAVSNSLTPRMTITSSGNVLIGTTTDNGAKLQVTNGNGISFSSRSGASNLYTYAAFGRTSDELAIGIAGAADQFFTGSVAGDAVIKALGTNNRILLGYGTSTALTITSSGIVDIAGPLIVRGTLPVDQTDAAVIDHFSNTMRIFSYGAAGVTGDFQFRTAAGGAGSNLVSTINGTTGAYTAVSDINKKKDFEESTIGLNAILGLKPTLYRMKTESNTQKHLGFIAQEVKQYIPNAYVENGDFIGLNEMPIIAALTKAIQELKQEIDTLKN